MKRNFWKKMLAAILAAACLASLGAPAMAVVEDWDIFPLVTQDNAVSRSPDPEAPAAWGALPDDAQLLYHDQELAAFIHFGVNTFTGREWGTGTENPNVFNPTAMTSQAEADAVAEEWVRAFQAGGFKRLILVGKHHDGFCIWPSEYTQRDTDSSSVPGVDVVWAVSKACTKYDMDMGFYLSPWDESAISYGYRDADGNALTKEQEAQKIENGELDELMDYNVYYDSQLREVLSNPKYGNDGKFVEVWMDGAKGTGAMAQDYDFDMWFRTIKDLEPDARTFSGIAGCGIRWSGNEKGISGAETCWQKMNINANGELIPGTDNKAEHYLGVADGSIWSVNECDVSIRNGWFHGAQRTFDSIMDMYYNSVGHSSVFLLNAPPDTTGRFTQSDIDLLKRFGDALNATYAVNFAAPENGASATTTQGTERTSATAGKFAAAQALDDDNTTYWTLQDGATSGQITIDMGQMRRFDLVSLQEYIPLGQRIAQTVIEYSPDGSNWMTFAETTTIGARRIVVDSPVSARYVRITVTNTEQCDGVPLLSSIGIYKTCPDMERSGGIKVPDNATFVDERDSSFTYNGSWSEYNNADGRENTHKGSDTANNYVTFPFTGSQFYVTGIVDPNHGPVEVTIDGTVVGTFDTRADARKTQQVLYASPVLSYGAHTVKLTVKTGSNNKDFFDFDGIYTVEGRNGILEFTQGSVSTREGGDVTLTVRRGGGAEGDISFKVIDLPGSAVSGQHYQVVDETFTLPAGQTEATVTAHTIAGSAAGKMFSLQIINPTGGAMLGATGTVDIHVVEQTAELTIAPSGATFTSDDPFPFPSRAGQVNRVEAEHMELDASGAVESNKYVRIVDGPDGGKHVGWLEDGNKVLLHYTAPKAGTYTMIAQYASGRGTDNPNRISWRGDHVEAGSQDVSKHGNDTNGTNYAPVEMELVVTQAGPGTLEFYADSHGGPNLDWFSFGREAVSVDAVSLAPAHTTLYINESPRTVTLTPTFTPAASADDVPLAWSSDNEAVATVTQDGQVAAVGAGTATITAAVQGGTASAQATVTVKAKITGVSIAGNTTVGSVLTAYAAPSEATVTYRWSRVSHGTETAIPAATGSTYTLTADDVGKQIKVTVTGTGSCEGTASSAPTAAVTAAGSSDPGSSPSRPSPSGPSGSAVDRPVTSTTQNADGSVTTTVTDPRTGEVTETVAKADGGKVEAVTTPAGDKTITVTDSAQTVLAKVELPAKITAAEAGFVDVPASHWADTSIRNMAGLGLITGVGGGQYDPTSPLTRGSMVTILHRLSQGGTDFVSSFYDVPQDAYYSDGVAWAVRAGVVKGVSHNQFAPDDAITREQLAVMMARFAQFIGQDTKSDPTALETFADSASTSSWARDAMAWCVEKGILQGKGGGALDPTAQVSRAEMAVMLNRFIDLV